jgi:hypothetical protein
VKQLLKNKDGKPFEKVSQEESKAKGTQVRDFLGSDFEFCTFLQ